MVAAVYACYGMPKSGSTLAFELTVAVLEEAGVPQRRLSPRVLGEERSDNFVPLIKPMMLRAAIQEISEVGHPRPIAIKTHGGVWAATAEAIAAGRVTGHAIARDPRDVALSILDASRTGGAWGARDGRPFANIGEAMEVVRGHVEKFLKWQAQPGFLTLNYEEVAFDTRRSIDRIAGHLDVDVDADRVLHRVRSRHTKLNKGISQRWREEMSVAEANYYYEEFADFIECWCLPQGIPGRV